MTVAFCLIYNTQKGELYMEDKIKLFLQYVKKEKELMLEFDREDGIDVDAEDY